MSEAVAAAQARALAAPSRRAIVAHLTAASEAVGVRELTEHLGLNHNAIRKHLARLVAAGLVVEEREPRLTPGRPRFVYRLAPDSDAGEERAYRRLAVLLAEAMASGDDPIEVGRRSAAAMPSSPGAGLDALTQRFLADGFDPTVRRRGKRVEVVLGRCPFADAAAANPEVVCRLHLGLAQGLGAGAGVQVESLTPKDPRRAGCCMRLTEAP